MPDKIDLSIVTVTWNSADEIYDCLRTSYDALNGINAEFIIIDNASEDRSLKEIERAVEYGIHRITVIENASNLGYTKACNQGIASSNGRHILLLNPDTKPSGDSLFRLVNELDSNPNLGAVAPQLLNTDGSVQHSCRTFPGYWDMFCEFTLLSSIFPKSRLFANWKMGYFDHKENMIVDQPMAAALLVNGKLMRELKGFDENFNMFFNDVDLCKRIYESGRQILFTVDAKVFHIKGASVKKVKTAMIGIWNDDCRKYFRKHFDKPISLFLLSASLTITGVLRKLYYKFIQ